MSDPRVISHPVIHRNPGPTTDPAADRARSRAVAVLVTTVALAVVVLLGMTSCSPEIPAAESETPGPRVQATPTGLMLDDSPWWPIGLNAYQPGTDWSVNEGCGAEVDLDAYFAALPPRSLTRFMSMAMRKSPLVARSRSPLVAR